MREGLRHLQQRDQVARLPPHLPARAAKALLSAAAQEQALEAGLATSCRTTSFEQTALAV